jgi:hypothetical protein
MRSPGNWRLVAERTLRVVSLLAMAALVWRLWDGRAVSGRGHFVTTASLDSALVSWSVAPPARGVIDATTVPGPVQRAWLVALRRAGLQLAWTAADSSGGALVVESGAPAGSPSRITAIGTTGRPALLFDDLGRIDSSDFGRGRVVSWRASPIGAATVSLPTSNAMAAARDSLTTRPVLVLGQAGWESRFVVTALEEIGWPVLAQLVVAPGAIVRQGRAITIDTATLSAVVVLDSLSSMDASAVSRFVRQGGGVVASGTGVRHPALRALMPRVDNVSAAEVGALLGTSPHNGLQTRTFIAASDAVPLERRGNEAVVLARRVGSGHVVAAGFDDTWRLRMIPSSESAPESHRTWWSSLVSSVALARPVSRDVGVLDEAPFAATIDALGPPLPAGVPQDRGPSWPCTAMLAVLTGSCLLLEWLSRRLRGDA